MTEKHRKSLCQPRIEHNVGDLEPCWSCSARGKMLTGFPGGPHSARLQPLPALAPVSPAPDPPPWDEVATAAALSHPYGDGAGGCREGCGWGWRASANHQLLNPARCYTAPPLPAPSLGLQQQGL